VATPDAHLPHGDETHLPAIIAALVAGQPGADERLCAVLRQPMAAAVSAFLGPDGTETDDIAQESLVAVLAYVTQRGGFEGNLVRFAVTVARNRCRNVLAWRRRRPHVEIEPLAEWIAAPDRDPLEAYGNEQVMAVLRASLGELDTACRDLLRALFLGGETPESMCSRLGLTTVRAVYYRRENCLKALRNIVMQRLGEVRP